MICDCSRTNSYFNIPFLYDYYGNSIVVKYIYFYHRALNLNQLQQLIEQSVTQELGLEPSVVFPVIFKYVIKLYEFSIEYNVHQFEQISGK